MGKQHYILSLVIIFAVVLAAEHYLPTIGTHSTNKNGEVVERDFFLTNMHTTVLHANGKPHYIVKAETVDHYPQNSIVKMHAVELTWYENQAAPWKISADKAILERKTEILNLEGNVKVHRPASKDSEETKLSTKELQIHPKKSYAETKSAVTIVSGKNRVTGVGMKMYLADGRVELLAATRAEYNVSK